MFYYLVSRKDPVCGESNLGRAFVTGDQLYGQFEGGDQELAGIVSRVARRDPADLHRRLCAAQRVKIRNAARFGESASDIVLGGDADILEFARVEFDARFTDDLVDDLIAVEVKDRQTVGFGDFIYMIGGEQAGGTGHVLHHDGGISRNMSAQMAADQPGVGVKTSAGGEADD